MKLKERKTVYIHGKKYFISPFEVVGNAVTKIGIVGGICFFVWLFARVIFGF